MIESIQTALAATLLRTLQLDPSLTPSEAIARVESILMGVPYLDSHSTMMREFLRTTAGRVQHRGVLNPTWLSQTRRIGLYYYMVRAQPRWLDFLEHQTTASEQSTYHVLYGDWDALISLHGPKAEADTLMERITATTPYEWVNMSASRVLLFHRHRTHDPNGPTLAEPGGARSAITAELVNRLVDDYDDGRLQGERLQLEHAGVFLGPIWQLTLHPLTDITAYVGINARGPVHNVTSDELLDALLLDEVVRTCLVHFMELEQAKPFQFMAKLVCRDLDELDRATDDIRARRIGRVTLETTTFVVARGVERLPLVSGQRSPDIVTPDTRGLEALAVQTLGRLGPKAIASFNALDASLQPMVLDSLYELQERLANGPWAEETRAALDAAMQLFSDAALEGVPPGSLHGPVINVARVVEANFKQMLERLVWRVYGRDVGRAQSELRLRTRKFNELTLGHITAALRTMKVRPEFLFIADVLDDEWLDRLDQFTDGRNRWAHSDRKPSGTARIEIGEARQLFSAGIDLLRWLFESVLPTLAGGDGLGDDGRSSGGVTLPARSDVRQFGVFISYSSMDTVIANRIALGLQALKYPVFYADWAIDPGQSIAGKISDGLVQSDTLLVLLSRSSVASAWVQLEFTAALMDQLEGQDVAVVPVLIEQCEIPGVLRGVKRIDMTREHFEVGFGQLIQFLSQRQQRHQPGTS
jgi:hypothetical protein